jgi:hypothetical protein
MTTSESKNVRQTWSNGAGVEENDRLAANLRELTEEIKFKNKFTSAECARRVTLAYWLSRKTGAPEFISTMTEADKQNYYRQGGFNELGEPGDQWVDYTQDGTVRKSFLERTFSETTFSKIMNGSHPATLPFVAAYCRAFNVPVELVYEGVFSFNFIYTTRRDFNWRGKLNEARHDLFVSAGTLSKYNEGKLDFLRIAENVQVRFLMQNLFDREILNGYARMRYKSLKIEKYTAARQLVLNDFFNALGNKKGISIALSDRITPMAFFAVDILKESDASFIMVQHYLHERDSLYETISYVTKPGSPVYETAKGQIEELWKHSQKQESTVG